MRRRGLNPILWSKRVYSGDTVVEMYAHNQMDLPKELGYSSPGNLNITLGGDGKNPASGYSFIVAGWSNTRTRIYKGTEMVAESSSESARFERPINYNFNFHKRWFYIRAEARRAVKNGQAGAQIRLLMDDELLAEYFDANPLPSLTRGGRVAFWTVDGTLMIARAKIESQNMGLKYVPADLVQAATPPVKTVSSSDSTFLVPQPVNADGAPTAFVEAQADSTSSEPVVYQVRNATPGGWFAVQLAKAGTSTTPLRATPKTQIEFDVALSPQSKVDLYVTVDEQRHLISLDARDILDASALQLGSARLTTSQEQSTLPPGFSWNHVTFDLGNALQKLAPGRGSWPVQAVEIGALHGDEYRLAGFGGNPIGATYYLRGFGWHQG
jgi:hypothetical protein